MGPGALPVVLTFLLVFVAWRFVFSLNKDLVRARAWGELARRSLPFVGITAMAATVPLVQGSGGAVPVVWVFGFGLILIASRFISEPARERKASKAFRAGDYERAASLYRELADRNPLARNYAFLGAALGAGERHEEAIEASTRSVELDPQYGLAYYNRALVLLRMGKKSRAVKDLKKALEVDLPRRFRTAVREILEQETA